MSSQAWNSYWRTNLGFFWTMMQGMKITITQMFKPSVTLQYPEIKWDMPRRMRGKLFNEVEWCIACLQCARVCPAGCITMATEGKKEDRKLTSFIIDLNKCLFCGFCVEPCPTKSLVMTGDYEFSTGDRQGDLIVEYAKEGGTPIPGKAECKERDKELEGKFWY